VSKCHLTKRLDDRMVGTHGRVRRHAHGRPVADWEVRPVVGDGVVGKQIAQIFVFIGDENTGHGPLADVGAWRSSMTEVSFGWPGPSAGSTRELRN
jgi:hypothetical protein